MTKKYIYNLIILFDKIFIYFQFIIINIISINKKKFTLIESKFGPGWGQLVQSVFYLNFFDKKKTPKILIILDYEKFNVLIQEFTENCKIIKIYSIFLFLNRDFSQYPKESEIKIKEFCKNIFANSFISMNNILYNQDRSFFNKKILSKYIIKKIYKQKIFSWHLHALNDGKNGENKKIIKPSKKCVKKIEKIFNFKKKEIENSIHISIRQRNKVLNDLNILKEIRYKILKNTSPFAYLKDGNVNNLKFVINYLLKNSNYKIFLTGDVENININHKNFFTYDNFKTKTCKRFYRLSLQTLVKNHITNSGGNSKIMQFNNCKILFLDAWPPITFQANSIFLFKNIINNKNKHINCFDYLKEYEKACKNQINKNSFEESLKIYNEFVNGKNFKMFPNTKSQILISLTEFLSLISNKKKINFKNKIFRKVPKYFQKILLENKCLLSSGNLKFIK